MFLAQANGIFHDKYSIDVFRGKEREDLVSDERLEQHGAMLSSFLLLFKEDSLPIWVSEKNRDSSFCGFNRHLVMHGESTNYDTERNSLKAVSFLCWLASVPYLMEP